jgi:hypothetical protein
MHSVIFHAIAPDDQAAPNWRSFIGDVDGKLKPYTNFERLAENVWLVNLRVQPAPLGFLVARAHAFHIEYRLLAFDDAPQWLPDVPDPTSTLDRSGA